MSEVEQSHMACGAAFLPAWTFVRMKRNQTKRKTHQVHQLIDRFGPDQTNYMCENIHSCQKSHSVADDMRNV